MTKFNKIAFTLVFSLVFVSLPLSGCYSSRQKELARSNDADEFTWDFGQVKEGQVYKHEFILKNETGKELIIKQVSTSCGCTVSEVKKKTISPGETALIEVSFNSTGYLGRTQQFVYVQTDNIDNPILRYIIKAEVVK